MPWALRLLYPALALAAQVGCLPLSLVPPAPSKTDSVANREALNATLRRYWRAVVPRRPDLALALGRPLESLPTSTSQAGDTRAVTLARRLGAELDEIDPAALTARDYATLQTLRWELDGAAEATTYRHLDFSILSPALTPVRHSLAALTEYRIGTVPDLDRYLFVLDGMSFWLLDARESLQLREKDGTLAPTDAVGSFRGFLEALRALVVRGELRVADARLATLDTALVRDFRAQEAEGTSFRVLPAIDTILVFLDGYEKRARPRPGLWQEPGGKEYYRHLLRRSLGVEIEPEEAHRVGAMELRRIDSLLAVVRRRAGWKGSGQAFHDSLRRDARFTPVTPAMAIARARLLLGQLRAPIATRMGSLPANLPEFRPASAMEALLYPDGLVRPPEFADSATEVVVTPAWGSRAVQAEGRSHLLRWTWPGRSLAATVSYSRDTLDPVALLHPSDATRLGWSEYAASMVGELGAYADPLDAYGRLLHEGWNAALLVADTGLNYFGWSRAQALAVLRPYSLATDAELDSLFIAQVVQVPGRAGAAMLGAREHAAMRTWMQRTLGESFDLAAWHGEVMSLGPVPLPVLAAYLEWWGWSERRRLAAAASRAKGDRRR